MPGYVLDDDVGDELPEEFEHILVWYTDLRNRAPRGQHYEPITLCEIEAYRQKLARAGEEMDPLDEDLLAIADGLWQEIVPERPASAS